MQPDADRFHKDLHELREETITLAALADRRIHVTRPTGPASTSVAPTPISLPAHDLLRRLDDTVRHIAIGAGLRFGRDTDLHDLLKGLDRPAPCATLAARADAWACLRLIGETLWQVRQMTDPEPTRRYVGICVRCGSPAWAPETQPADSDYRCPECGHLSRLADIIEAHQLRLLTSGAVDTTKGLRRLLASCGIHIKAGTIRQWAHRGKLKPAGHDDTGAPVYALADVLRLHRASA
ncbi:hypothetical protein [Bifidobacterium castoris]|uniref:PhnA protein n=1 Tax=Bifidobacterium castoris TaxID=2306972 RepID=A0A430F5A0_9BIFI|nr:hypothetical protein [Bifidobacterium castoris]RSX46104.1 hypothetical protein D2E22_1676 [Bifidobacterium castoris]